MVDFQERVAPKSKDDGDEDVAVARGDVNAAREASLSLPPTKVVAVEKGWIDEVEMPVDDKRFLFSTG